MIRLACPHCQTVHNAPDKAAGTVATCLKCRGRFQIPPPLKTEQTLALPESERAVIRIKKEETFEFHCPECKATHEALLENVGLKIYCSCGQKLQIPMPSEPVRRKPRPAKHSPSPPMEQVVPPLPEMAFCPFCKEEIRAEATKCKHCGEFLSEGKPPPGSEKGALEHSAWGVCSCFWGLLGLMLMLVALSIGMVWMNTIRSRGLMETYLILRHRLDTPEARNNLPDMHLFDISGFFGLVAIGAILLGLLFAALSFLERAKRFWSIAGCIINGLLSFWIFFRMGLL